jgi:mannose-6-phosphate isomerase
MENLYPLKLVVLPKEKVWGGSKIARTFYKDLAPDRPIGEVWVVWGELTVENGVFRGERLDDLVRDYPLPILGSRVTGRQYPTFPLLVKILDARATLSVQVHPDDAYANEREGEPFGKAEAWYILDAERQARLIHGVQRPLSRRDAAQAIEAGTLQETLDYVEVAPGDVIFNGPGTIHALGGGILLYELQQSSDLTYRLYDWDRRDPSRPLHIEKSLDVAILEPFAGHKIEPVERVEAGGRRTLLCACRHFAAEVLQVASRLREQPSGDCFHILTILQGSGSVRYGTSSVAEMALCCGESLLVPAGIHEYELWVERAPLIVIKAYVPELMEDIVVPLRESRVPEGTIAQLGGDPRYSELGRLLTAS